jgi:hypothetical protein
MYPVARKVARGVNINEKPPITSSTPRITEIIPI